MTKEEVIKSIDKEIKFCQESIVIYKNKDTPNLHLIGYYEGKEIGLEYTKILVENFLE